MIGKEKLFFCLIVAVILSSCKSDRDMLALAGGSVIMRSEFHNWLVSRKISPDQVYKDIYSMQDYLKQLAVEKLTSEKAKVSGLEKNNDYTRIKDIIYRNYLSSFYEDEMVKKITFDEKVADINIIRLSLNKKQSPLQKNIRATKDDINADISELFSTIQAKLTGGEKFDDLARKYSDDASSAKGGYVGAIPYSIMNESLRKAISELSPGDHTINPIREDKSVYIIKLNKNFQINQNNISDSNINTNNIERIKRSLVQRQIDLVMNGLLLNRDVISNIGKAVFASKNEKLFTVNDVIFLTEDVDRILDLFFFLKHGFPPYKPFSIAEKRFTAEKIFKERLISGMAVSDGIDRNPLCIRNWYFLERASLAGYYKYNYLISSVSVTEMDLLKEYSENMEKRYSSDLIKDGQSGRKPIPYNKAKQRIYVNIMKFKIKDAKRKFDENILRENGYLIIDREFR